MTSTFPGGTVGSVMGQHPDKWWNGRAGEVTRRTAYSSSRISYEARRVRGSAEIGRLRGSACGLELHPRLHRLGRPGDLDGRVHRPHAERREALLDDLLDDLPRPQAQEIVLVVDGALRQVLANPVGPLAHRVRHQLAEFGRSQRAG